MAKVKVQFPITVKYQRVIYPPYTNILADTEDLPDMKKAGAVIFEEESVEEKISEEVVAPKTSKSKSQRKNKSGRLVE
jgi:hypothetical protein|nr:MAG TPA: hypothetical protein [Caudoviricetes sp.]